MTRIIFKNSFQFSNCCYLYTKEHTNSSHNKKQEKVRCFTFFSILTATVVFPGLKRRFIAVPQATSPKAPLPMTFSIVTRFLATSQERVEEARNQHFEMVFAVVRYLVLLYLWDHCQIKLPLVSPYWQGQGKWPVERNYLDENCLFQHLPWVVFHFVKNNEWRLFLEELVKIDFV